MNLKQFLKPEWRKIVLFLTLFLIMFIILPFVELLPSGETKSVLWLIKNYSDYKEEALSGVIIYFLFAYFISCVIILFWKDLKRRKL